MRTSAQTEEWRIIHIFGTQVILFVEVGENRGTHTHNCFRKSGELNGRTCRPVRIHSFGGARAGRVGVPPSVMNWSWSGNVGTLILVVFHAGPDQLAEAERGSRVRARWWCCWLLSPSIHGSCQELLVCAAQVSPRDCPLLQSDAPTSPLSATPEIAPLGVNAFLLSVHAPSLSHPLSPALGA